MTGPRVLVDTGAWLAAFHRRDQYHDASAATMRRLRAERARLVVTDLILAELHLHLVHALSPRQAADHLSALKTDPLLDEVHTDPNLQAAALTDWIRRFDQQSFTLTDAVSFATMAAHRIPAAFTFDRHFAVAGFEMVPPA